MKQILPLSLLLLGLLSCSGAKTSDSNLTAIELTPLETLSNISGIKEKLNGKTLTYYSLTIEKDPDSDPGCSKTITQTSEDQSNDYTVQLITESNETECVYTLTMLLGLSKSEILFKGTTGIGPGTDNPYNPDDETIRIQMNVEDYKTGKTYD